MVKARELVAVDQIKSAVTIIENALKDLELETSYMSLRIRQPKRFMEGLTPEKGNAILEALTTCGFAITLSEKDKNRPKVEHSLTINENFYIYVDIAENPLARLKAEQERIAAEIAALEGEEHGTA